MRFLMGGDGSAPQPARNRRRARCATTPTFQLLEMPGTPSNPVRHRPKPPGFEDAIRANGERRHDPAIDPAATGCWEGEMIAAHPEFASSPEALALELSMFTLPGGSRYLF